MVVSRVRAAQSHYTLLSIIHCKPNWIVVLNMDNCRDGGLEAMEYIGAACMDKQCSRGGTEGSVLGTMVARLNVAA